MRALSGETIEEFAKKYGISLAAPSGKRRTSKQLLRYIYNHEQKQHKLGLIKKGLYFP